MESVLYYMYSEKDRDKGPVAQKLYQGTVEEAIGWCLKVKDLDKVTPVGFSIFQYESTDENDVEIEDYNRYFFNGKIVTKDNIPYNWNYTKMFKEYDKLVCIGDDFCYPFNDETDNILKINI